MPKVQVSGAALESRRAHRGGHAGCLTDGGVHCVENSCSVKGFISEL
jgi:hypothetical protein